jgi:hypothetical protein
MRFLLLLTALIILSCQELPKEFQGPEGKKRLEALRNQFVKGEVVLSENFKGKLPQKPFFLIIAVKKPDNPQPIAVLRVENPEFPFKFTISGKHKIDSRRLIEGDLIITARISKNAGASVSGGDLMGSAQAKAGSKDVKIEISIEVPEDSPPKS